MTPTAPYGVTVSVYLPWLTLTLGSVQAQGMWLETGRLVPRAFKAIRAPRTRWQKAEVPRPCVWEREKP